MTGYEQGDEFEISLIWNEKKELQQITLGGELVQGGIASGTTTDAVKATTVTPSPPVAGEVKLAAELTLADYPIKIEGTVTATECPK